MIQALRRNGGGPLRLGEDESALNDRLHVQRQTLRGPIGSHAVFPHGGANVRFKRLRMPTDAFFASGADLGMCAIGFLNDSSDEAGEFRQFASQKRSTKFNVREESIARIGRLMIRRRGEKLTCARLPVRGRAKSQVLLALEVMKETPLCQAGFGGRPSRRCRAIPGAA